VFPNLCPGANVAFLPETSDVLFKFNFIFYYFLRQRQANRQIDETVFFFLAFLYYT